ncbi:hypothetical protein Kfla_1573 [Kribbella flavida DSM 17836]|uniref:Uncharacterized protein n=2 Tax=Kribbella flavida TaxID=182640 RepID=D2PLP1_KRIFD|nr:hypothetical protein Kfla_1573 [Kribbella flavida DSM 17836]
MLWYVAVVAALLWGFPLFGWILAGLLGAVVLGSLVSQAFRRHRGFCWLGRGAWFGIAVPGVPLRALAALPSF